MINKKGFNHGEVGQTLLEILLAFSVSILVLSAVILSISASLSNTQYTKNQGLANSYAQEGMAVIRQMKDSSWPDFLAKNQTNYCLAKDPAVLVPLSNCGQNVDFFSRKIKIEHDTSDCSAGTPPTPTPPVAIRGTKVTVTVSWADSKCNADELFCHNVELVTCFSNVDQKQEP